MHIGQPPVDTLVAEGEFFVVDAEEVEDGGVEVVAVDGINGFPGPFVGLAMGGSGFEAGAGEEARRRCRRCGRGRIAAGFKGMRPDSMARMSGSR